MNLQEFIQHRLSQKNFIHDFSLGSLFAYHKVLKLNEEDRVHFDENYIHIKGQKSDELIVYKQTSKLEGIINDIEPEKKLLVSCATTIPILPKYKSKHEEVFYQLEQIPTQTGNKLYHSFSKPIAIIQNRPDLGITLEDIAGQAGLEDLHNEWVKYKLSLPTTHRISFPTARYRGTLQELYIPRYAKAIYIKGQLYGFIIFSLENEVAFELSFCSLFWKPEFKILNGLNQYLFSYCLIDMMKSGIRYVNSGFVLNKNLKIFKQTSQTSNSVFRYTYQI